MLKIVRDQPPVLKAALESCRRHFVYALLFSALLNLLFIAPILYMLQVYDRVIPTAGLCDPRRAHPGAGVRAC